MRGVFRSLGSQRSSSKSYGQLMLGLSPDYLRCCPMPSGWHHIIWTLNHPDELAPGRISSGWLMVNAGCHPDDLRYFPVSSGSHGVIQNRSDPGELASVSYLIWMTYGQCRIPSGWLTMLSMLSGWHGVIQPLSHPDELAPGRISFGSLMDIVVGNLNNFWYCSMSSRWHNVIWKLSSWPHICYKYEILVNSLSIIFTI